jgi:hypothetical protein
MVETEVTKRASEMVEDAESKLPKFDHDTFQRGIQGLIKRAYFAGEPTRSRRPKFFNIITQLFCGVLWVAGIQFLGMGMGDENGSLILLAVGCFLMSIFILFVEPVLRR